MRPRLFIGVGKDKKSYLLERFELGDASREAVFEKEVSALQKVAGHPLIAKIESIFYDRHSGNAAFIQFDYPSQGTLRTWLFGGETRAAIASQATSEMAGVQPRSGLKRFDSTTTTTTTQCVAPRQ